MNKRAWPKPRLLDLLIRCILFAIILVTGVSVLSPPSPQSVQSGESKIIDNRAKSSVKNTDDVGKPEEKAEQAAPTDNAVPDNSQSPIPWLNFTLHLTAVGLCGILSHAIVLSLLPPSRRFHKLQRFMLNLSAALVALIGYTVLQGLLWYSPEASLFSLNVAANWPYLLTTGVCLTAQLFISRIILSESNKLPVGKAVPVLARQSPNRKTAPSGDKITQLWIAKPFAPWRRITLVASKNSIVVLEKPSLFKKKKHSILYVNIGSVGVETSWLIGATVQINSVRWGERHLKIKNMPERKAELFAQRVLDRVNKIGGERR